MGAVFEKNKKRTSFRNSKGGLYRLQWIGVRHSITGKSTSLSCVGNLFATLRWISVPEAHFICAHASIVNVCDLRPPVRFFTWRRFFPSDAVVVYLRRSITALYCVWAAIYWNKRYCNHLFDARRRCVELLKYLLSHWTSYSYLVSFQVVRWWEMPSYDKTQKLLALLSSSARDLGSYIHVPINNVGIITLQMGLLLGDSLTDNAIGSSGLWDNSTLILVWWLWNERI